MDDERFLQPFIEKHPTKSNMDRPTDPIEKYLRLMVLKRKYNLGYESLIKKGSRRQHHLAPVLPNRHR